MARPLNSIWLFLLGMLGLHLAPVTAQASDAAVLCSPELPGESTRAGDVGCVDVLSWGWGQSRPVSLGGGGPPAVGVASLQSFSFTKFTDSSSEDMFRLTVTSVPIKGVVEYRQYRDCGVSCQAPEPYLTINFREVWFESLQTSSSGTDRPLESASFNFADVSFCYRPTLQDGSLDTAQCFAYSKNTNAPIAPF